MTDAPRAASNAVAMHRFCIGLMACALAAAGLPALLLWRAGPTQETLAVLGASATALALMVYLLSPLGAVSKALQACLAEIPEGDEPAAQTHGAGGLMAAAAELSARIERLRQRLGNRHAVTGLPTREPLLAELAKAVEGSEQTAVLGTIRFVDYDRLAAFDQAGADLALKGFADRLRDSIPRSRPLAQVDRDCFAVWLDGADRDLAASELKALAYVLGQDLTAGQATLTPEIAVGAAVFPNDGQAPSELLTRSMAALEGRLRRGAVNFYSAQSSAAAKERFSLEQDLRGAVAREELMLQFQPLVDLEQGRPVGAEALLRWRHPTLGMVAPDRFIPLLEQSGMMGEVGLWVLNTACREVRTWREHGLGDLKMAVNLSAVQCNDPRLTERVIRTLERHGLPPSSLELELTETAAMEDADHIRRLFTDLRTLGVSVAIDDFGAGYSSLSYLKNLPFSKLKIDREFVKDVNVARDSRAICAALLALSQGLGISVLAEGVETMEQVETLRAMGCRLFQGYVFARPLDGPEFLKTVTDPAWLAKLSTPPAVRPQPRRLAG
jgi:Amt family ammonium transporter